MNFRQTYCVNMPTVVSEVFDNEVVIIHLESGAYYSLDQSSAMIWELLQQSATISEIVAKLAAIYESSPGPLSEAVQKFIEELRSENLIIANNIVTAQNHQPDAKTIRPSPTNANQPFTPPHLHKYTDMQDLLLLDPIHDVTETGWPHVAVR